MSKSFELVSGQFSEIKVFRQVGFKVLLAWHYLVLFSPLLIGSVSTNFQQIFFDRQLTLYITLAFTFAFIAFTSNYYLKKRNGRPSTALMISMGLMGVVASAAAILLSSYALLFSTVALGISEAFLMFFWLRYYQLAVASHLYRSFAIDMIFGALIAFVVCVMVQPFSSIMTIMLPAIAFISLIACWKTSSYPSGKPFPEEAQDAKPPRSDVNFMRHFLSTIMPTTVFAFVFGLLQGSYISDGIVLLMATDPLIILGIATCGIILLLIPDESKKNGSIDTIHRLSLLFFVVGVVSLPLLEGWGIVASEASIMAGFNLFDFGAMAIGIAMTKQLRVKGSFFIGGGRAFTYLGLTFGLVIGHVTMILFPEHLVFSYLLGGVAVVLIVTTVFTPFHKMGGGETDLDENAVAGQEPTAAPAMPAKAKKREGSDVPRDTPWRRVCGEVATRYKLSPRETEIFFLIAKGRNAEYVQQKLVISTHTAKTHIANIYHKLGVHSSQEMLNLIEAFQDQEREERESQLK